LFGALSSRFRMLIVDRVAGAFPDQYRRPGMTFPPTPRGDRIPGTGAAALDHRQNERDRRIAISAAPRFGIVGQTQTMTSPTGSDVIRASPASAPRSDYRDGER
jgi:hypothetical protein